MNTVQFLMKNFQIYQIIIKKVNKNYWKIQKNKYQRGAKIHNNT